MIPLVLLTGFLGAGKTTFLRRLLTPLIGAGVRPHVILNDYANADLDSATLRDLVPNIQPLTGSCVCCNSMDDLLGALDDLALGERDVVLVEANGTTDPLPLLEVLLLTRLQRRFPCLCQINLIDAKRWQQRGTNDELERMQARTASHLHFTWMDTTTKDRQLRVREGTKKLNPRAVEVTAESFANRLLALIALPDDAAPPAFVAWPRGGIPGQSTFSLPSIPGGKPARPASDEESSIFSSPLIQNRKSVKHALAHRFQAIQLEVPHGLRPLQLVAWLESLPQSVIRAKGIIEFADQPRRFHYFQRVEDTVSFKEMLIQPPDDLTLALLVGIGLDEVSLRADARRFLTVERANGSDPTGDFAPTHE